MKKWRNEGYRGEFGEFNAALSGFGARGEGRLVAQHRVPRARAHQTRRQILQQTVSSGGQDRLLRSPSR